MIGEHDRIVLTQDVPAAGLIAGDVGTVVHAYPRGEAFEVEFMTLSGETVAVTTLRADQVRPVRSGDITHVREAETAPV